MQDQQEIVQGLSEYRTCDNVYVLRVHYTADPAKRSPEWIAHEKSGMTREAWEREYEINYNVYMGKPFYPEFSYERHVSTSPLIKLPGRAVIRAWDYGLTPATLFGQLNAKGQLLIQMELQSFDCGITNHGSVVSTESTAFYPGCIADDVGDPAGNQRSQNDEVTANQILATKYGIHVKPGEMTLTGRSEAVREHLTALTPTGEPKIIVSPECSLLIGGLTGGYHRKEVAGRLLDEPEKNEYSHIANCFEYMVCHVFGKKPKKQNYREADIPIYGGG